MIWSALIFLAGFLTGFIASALAVGLLMPDEPRPAVDLDTQEHAFLEFMRTGRRP